MKVKIATAALATFTLLSFQAAAQDGSAMYKARCAGCHGEQGQGKPPVGPKLAGTTKSVAEVAAVVTKGGEPKPPHTKALTGITADQANAVAAYVKTLK